MGEVGEQLLGLHIGYQIVEPWPLKRSDVIDERSRNAGLAPKALLRSDKEIGIIQVDSETQLTGVPASAWAYKLGSRSALEWILDQYSETPARDKTIKDKFEIYSFSEYKERVIDLLTRVTRVSVETQRIVNQMRELAED